MASHRPSQSAGPLVRVDRVPNLARNPGVLPSLSAWRVTSFGPCHGRGLRVLRALSPTCPTGRSGPTRARPRRPSLASAAPRCHTPVAPRRRGMPVNSRECHSRGSANRNSSKTRRKFWSLRGCLRGRHPVSRLKSKIGPTIRWEPQERDCRIEAGKCPHASRNRTPRARQPPFQEAARACRHASASRDPFSIWLSAPTIRRTADALEIR